MDGYISQLASDDVQVWIGPINLQDGTEYLADGEVASDTQIGYLPALLERMEGSGE